MRHESKHGEEGFQAEAASLSQIHHRNLVQLLGWCHEEERLFLVYDYMINDSLDEWLFQSSGWKETKALPLGLRYSVLSGMAAASRGVRAMRAASKHQVQQRATG